MTQGGNLGGGETSGGFIFFEIERRAFGNGRQKKRPVESGVALGGKKSKAPGRKHRGEGRGEVLIGEVLGFRRTTRKSGNFKDSTTSIAAR